MNVLVVGRGRVGNGLHRALRAHRGIEVKTIGRHIASAKVAEADVIILAVPDDAIESLSERIAPFLGPKTTIVHCAGSRGPEVLRACKTRGASIGVMHPLVSFPSKRHSPALGGTTLTVAGDRNAIAASRQIAGAIGARVVVGTTGDAAYHAAAALAANGAAALAFASVSVLERLGFERRAAERAVGGLLESVGRNVQRLGIPEALTGPIVRGEATTVRKHRDALRRVSRDALRTYDALVPVVVRCARAAGLSKANADAVLRTLEP